MWRQHEEGGHHGEKRAVYNNAQITQSIQIGDEADPEDQQYPEGGAESCMQPPVVLGALMYSQQYDQSDSQYGVGYGITQPPVTVKDTAGTEGKDYDHK